jgi:hypothetical protein
VAFTLDGDLPPEVYPLAWLVGTWRGEGTVGYPGIPEAATLQEVSFTAADGPYLVYRAATWLVEAPGEGEGKVPDGAPTGEAGQLEAGQPGQPGQLWHQESGFWRVTPGQTQADPPFEIEVFVADPAGVVSVYLGEANGPRIQIGTDAMVRTASAPRMDAATRMYGLVEGDLLWAWDLAAFGESLRSYMASRLHRVS